MNRRFSVLVALAALVAGCGSDGEQKPGAAAASGTTTAAPSLAGTYERRLTHADIERTDDRRNESQSGQHKPDPGPLRLTLARGTLTMTDMRAGLTVRQDFSATSDGT